MIGSGALKFELDHVTLPRPFQGRFVIRTLGLAMFNPDTKFEVSTITCYEDMNSNTKCRNCGVLGWLGATQGHRQCSHSIEHIRLPIRL